MTVFVPTARAAALVAAAAPLALVLAAIAPAAWIAAPLFGALVLCLAVVDAVLAGRLAEWTLDTRRDVEVGARAPLRVDVLFTGGTRGAVSAAFAGDPRLLPGGRVEVALAPDDSAHWRGTATLAPTRRGPATIAGGWLRWTGPLGLGARQARRTFDRPVRVWPNLEVTRSPALQMFLKESQYGLIARRIRGEGTQFEALSEYAPGMDRRRIDWKASARHAHLYAKEFEAERNNQIVFALDCGAAMCEPVAGLPRIDRAVSAALATAYVALKGGDRVALFGFAARPEAMTPFVADAREFHRLQSAAATLDYHSEEPNFTLALATLAGRLQRRSLVIVFSEFSDPTSAELMLESIGRLVSRHVVLFVTMTDAELEGLAAEDPRDLGALSEAVSADALLRTRALVLRRLRQMGVEVVEAPHADIGTRLIDAYLSAKRDGRIG